MDNTGDWSGDSPCEYMEPKGGDCDCNESVDTRVFYAESENGKNWTIRGEVNGAYNRNGAETSARAVGYVDGVFYLISGVAQGGSQCRMSKGTDPMSLDPLGKMYSYVDLPSEPNDMHIHPDKRTITVLCKTSKDWTEGGLAYASTTIEALPSISGWTRLFPLSSTYKQGKFFLDRAEGKWLMIQTENDLDDIVALTAPASISTSARQNGVVSEDFRRKRTAAGIHYDLLGKRNRTAKRADRILLEPMKGMRYCVP